MTPLRSVIRLIIAAVFAALYVTVAPVAAATIGCVGDIVGQSAQDYLQIGNHQKCDPEPAAGPTTAGPPREWIDCGSKVSLESVSGGLSNPCQQVATMCEKLPRLRLARSRRRIWVSFRPTPMEPDVGEYGVQFAGWGGRAGGVGGGDRG